MRWLACWLTVVCVYIAGCVQSQLQTCGAHQCPLGQVCGPSGQCATTAAIAACDGLADEAGCQATSGAIGFCRDGVCVTGLCGNGEIDVGEACDDSNTTAGDGCAANCSKVEACGDAVVDAGEGCDDGNQNPRDGCDACNATEWIADTLVGGGTLSPTQSRLALPHGVAVDAQDRLYIADTYNHRILRIESDGRLTQIAGTGTPGFNGLSGNASQMQLSGPYGVAVDGAGRVYVADTGNSAIRRINTNGSFETIAGTGTAGYAGDGGMATDALLRSPFAVVVSGLGEVFISDSYNQRIRKIDMAGNISTIAGTGPTGDNAGGFNGDSIPATQAQLNVPWGLALDSVGRLYIADYYSHRVRRIELNGVITTVAGIGVGQFAGDGGPASDASLFLPSGVAIDFGDRIFITERFNFRVRRIDNAGMITTVVGSGNGGSAGDGGPATSAGLVFPTITAIDGHGNLYVADNYNHKVRKISNETITTVAGTGMLGNDNTHGATQAALGAVYGLALLNNELLFTDNGTSTVGTFDAMGESKIVAGIGFIEFGSDGGRATETGLFNPFAVTASALGEIYIADTYRHIVRKIDKMGMMHIIAGTPQSAGDSGDGADAKRAQLHYPQGLAVTTDGRVYIADGNNHRIRMIDSNGVISTVAGTGIAGFSGDGLDAKSSRLNLPVNLALDSQQRLLIADEYNHRIRRLELDGTMSTVAGGALAEQRGPASTAQDLRLDNPRGIAVDKDDNVFIADTNNFRIIHISATNGQISFPAGNGSPGASGDFGPAIDAQLNAPCAVAVDTTGQVYIADTYNYRIRKIDNNGIITTVVGLIESATSGPAATAHLSNPLALAATPLGTLFAGGVSGTIERLLTDAAGSQVQTVAGRYPQQRATANLAAFRTTEFGTVGGIAYDPASSRIFVTEAAAQSNRIHAIFGNDPTNNHSWTIDVLANSDGLPGFADGPAAEAKFRAPSGIFYDAVSRTLYIADTGNHAIRALSLSTMTISTLVNRRHSFGFGGDGAAADNALLDSPAAVTRCSNGDIFIADTGNHRIRRVAAATGLISTVLGDGADASSGEGAPSNTYPVESPRGLVCDSIGNVFVTSTTTVRMLAANSAGIVDGTGAVQTIYGQAPRQAFPASSTACLSGITLTAASTLQIVDACAGLLVELRQQAR